MEENKINKLDESITLLDETIKEVGTIKQKSVELKSIMEEVSLLKNDYQNGIVKIEEQVKESKKLTDGFQKSREETKKILKENNQKVNKSLEDITKKVEDINKKIDKSLKDINKKMESIESKFFKIIIGVSLLVIILLITNLFI